MSEPLLDVRGVSKTFTVQRREVHAVDDVSFSIQPGQTFGLVGESGCGKTTTGRMIAGLVKPSSGSILLRGESLTEVRKRREHGAIQMIFQDPYSSFNPRLSIGATLSETLQIHGVKGARQRTDRVVELLEHVGFRETDYHKLPHQFSGGQRQRIAIARAVSVEPSLVICDEPVSALDVSLQAQVLNLLKRMQREMSLSLLFISHDMSVVRFMSDRIGVMNAGQIVEVAATDRLMSNPQHSYTRTLLDAVPSLPSDASTTAAAESIRPAAHG